MSSILDRCAEIEAEMAEKKKLHITKGKKKNG